MIAIIDYGAGNLNSVKNTLDYLGIKSTITNNRAEIESAERIILPGVGSFGAMMQNLRERELDITLKNLISKGIPFFGICLGLQALFEKSEESPGIKGLEVFKGKVLRFQNGKIPQIGWNKVLPIKNGFFSEDFFYFINSYYVCPGDNDIIAAKTDYFGEFASAIQYKNITATQFHPEKSGKAGIELFRRWLKGLYEDD
jgi:imidazole glycerol phosphate synthase glutamine amidotransferase subunit